MPASEREIWRTLIEDYHLTYPYPEDLFYKTHKISRKDFIDQLKSATTDQQEQMIMKLYEDDSQQGRRGVLTVEESVVIVKKKMEDKDRFIKFAQKFGRDSGLFGKGDEIPMGQTVSSLRDLV